MAPASSYTVTVDFPYASKYVFRGVELAQGSFQPSVKVTAGDFYAGLWTNQPVTRNTDNEIDLFAGYGFALNENWSLDLGGTLYYYPEANTSLGLDEHTFEGYVGVTGAVGGVNLGAYTYYDFDLKSLTIQGNIGYSIPLSAEASLDFSANLGHVSPDGASDYTYYGAGVAVPYKLTDHATVTGGVNYASHDITGLEGSHLWYNVGINLSF